MIRPAMSVSGWLRFDLLNRLLPTEAEQVTFLEIGCGLGGLGARLARRFDYTAYEMDQESAAEASRTIGTRGTVKAMPLPNFPDRQFDLVGAFEVLEHIKDDQSALCDWLRWLKPGGHLLMSVPAHPERFGPNDIKVGHYRRYSRQRLQDLLDDAGMQETILLAYGFPLANVGETIRHWLARKHRDDLSMHERTAASGRWLQFPDHLSWLPALLAVPFRFVQRPLVDTDLGVGFVVRARKPA